MAYRIDYMRLNLTAYSKYKAILFFSRRYSIHPSLPFFLFVVQIYAIYTYKFQKSIILNLPRNNWQPNKSFYRVYVSLFARESAI